MHIEPAAHAVAPVHPSPPHCPYLGTVPTATADVVGVTKVFSVVDVGAFAVVVSVTGLADELVATFVDVAGGLAGVVEEDFGTLPPPLPPHTATGPPGALYVVGSKPL